MMALRNPRTVERREMERVMDQAQNFRRSQLDGIVSKGKHSIKHQSVKFVLARIEYESVKSSRVLNITRNARFSSRTDFAISVWRKDRSLRIALRRTSNVLKLDVGEQHHTLMHRPSPSKKRDSSNLDQREQHDQDRKPSNRETGTGDTQDSNKQLANHVASVAGTGTGESRICLGVVPVRLQGTGGTREVQT